MGGANPFRETAEMRARQWEIYDDTRRAYEAQLAHDTSQLHKILPLASVTESAKLDLLMRFARAYGAAEAAPLISLLPGVALRSLPTAPRQLPFHAGFHYFELDRGSELWKQVERSGSVAMAGTSTRPI